MPIAVNGINHFAISVPDLEASIAWYERIFGFTVIQRSVIPGIDAKVSHMQGPGFQLELFQVPGAHPLPAGRSVPNADLMTHGNKHMALGVVDGPKAKAELEALGVSIVKVAEIDGTYDVFITDSAGNLIEVFEEGPR